MIDPLYVDIKNDVNVLIYTRSFNIFTREFDLPTYRNAIFTSFANDQEIVITEEIYKELVSQNLLNEVVTYTVIDGINYEAYAQAVPNISDASELD